MDFLRLLVVVVITFAFGGVASAQSQVPDKRVIFEADLDLVGTDIAQIFDTTLDACQAACLNNARCEAFTFNQISNACFPKRDITGVIPFQGAVSARVYPTDPVVLSAAADRISEISFLDDRDFARAADLTRRQNQPLRNANPAQISAWIRALETDSAIDWVSFGNAAEGQNTRIRGMALPAFTKAYLRSRDPAVRRLAAVELANALERDGRGRMMIDALRRAQAIRFDPQTEVALGTAIGKYGFRVVDTQVDSESTSPRICATFSEDLVKAGIDYTPFVQLPETQMVVSANGRQLCIDGVSHGARYRFVLREGLPAASGEALSQQVELSLYVRDRAPLVRFVGRAYVLPRHGDIAVPVETVNMSALDLTLHRIDDRNILRSIQSGLLADTAPRFGDDPISAEIGTEIWTGHAEVAEDLNSDMLTRLPLRAALADAPAGLYALTAGSADGDERVATATQWFVLSDIGVASYWGNDGLTVAARRLADAAAMQGATVTLLSRSNAVLSEATTDAGGIARFASSVTRGTGGNAPALLTVAAGEDLTFLSLTDPAFDLSDRGVAGREPSPPIDVFLATDRGAYRAGDTIHVTALMRDAVAAALPGVPLTAVLTRPDGVEYSRQVSTNDVAGGHVFDLTTAKTAPRGTWQVAMFADPQAAPLARSTVLVEDFLPERIDFDLSLPDEIRLGDTPNLEIGARYLFGAVGADLAVEGEALLRAASNLKAFPGYRFGQYDLPLETELTYLPGGRTGADGISRQSVPLPELSSAAPLELRVTARVKEGSGRPVERQITAPVLPDSPMIGIKPRFDGVLSENSEASFDLIGITPELASANLPVAWTINKITTRYQWYRVGDRWNWEPTTTRRRIASGEATLADIPVTVDGQVAWGRHEIIVETTSGAYAAASIDFNVGWYATATIDDTPDLLEASLDAESYAIGDTATFRIVPRYDGVAVVTVMADRVIAMRSVPVVQGENLIDLPVTEEWGAGAYVSASVVRPMSVAAGHNPARAIGLGYATVDPGEKSLAVSFDVPTQMEPRQPLDVAINVAGVADGETAYVTLAAVDVGILNLTAFGSPDPQSHYFGQRKLGVELRDVYGRLIDGLNGAMGTVRSGGDAVATASLQSPPPTEELVTFFSGPVAVDPDGLARIRFDLPAFNGTLRLMAIAWSPTGVGQAAEEIIVRDPIVVTASVPRFLAPGDQSRMLLEVTHADGPTGELKLAVNAQGIGLVSQIPDRFDLASGGKAAFEIPIAAFDPGDHQVEVELTAPDGRVLRRTLIVPVRVNDPVTSRMNRFTLDPGSTFTFDDNVFAGLASGTGKATLSVGPLARFDAPGLLSTLDTYPYGCTEQITSRALPLLYLGEVATAMGLATQDGLRLRVEQAIAEVTGNQAANGAFGLWRPASGDLWLDAYVTDFLTRARNAGYSVPDLAHDNALANLRNTVNFYPDFDSGGRDLAYALFVLAREGAAAVGDLRYYADQKSDAFSSPLALAQLGAALAQYGDQVRADALFGQAGRTLNAQFARKESQLWRSDFGTHRRDTAAVLTLAIEAGSDALDRGDLLRRIAGQSGVASTQEAAWTLLAAHALVDDLRSNGVTIDGEAPIGPLVQLRDAQAAEAPVLIANTSNRPTEITLTTFGVPTDPPAAGGNGYAIERQYFTMQGQPAEIGNLPVGTRLVTVLTIRPFGRQEARLMVNDPLPAGLEIDNPNLLTGGEVSALDWLAPTATQNAEFRSDRFLAAVDWRSDKPFQLAYIVRAISPGRFHHPAALVEDMYRPQMRATSAAGQVTISE